MARAIKAFLNWPRWHHHVCSRAVMIPFLHPPLPFSPASFCRRPPFSSTSLVSRQLSSRSGAIRLREVPVPPESSETGSDSDTVTVKKSRNEKKREAQRAVRWGMELAKFQPPQIKRILRVAALEREVYEAIMLVKRLGRDVREGKRRQFNYIGRLLRDVEPELMDGLIEATKDGDQNKFQALSGSITWSTEDENDDEVDETEYDDDDDDDDDNEESIELADRWFDGLMNKDIEVSNEIYSLREVEFDRQELRSLVRKVQSIQRPEVSEEEKESEVDMTFLNAKKSLTRFLLRIAKQLPSE